MAAGLNPSVQPLSCRRQHTSTSSPAMRNCESNPPIAWSAALRNAILQPGICSASTSESRTCVGPPGALATQPATFPAPAGAILAPPRPRLAGRKRNFSESRANGPERGLRATVTVREAELPVFDVVAPAVPFVGPCEHKGSGAAGGKGRPDLPIQRGGLSLFGMPVA